MLKQRNQRPKLEDVIEEQWEQTKMSKGHGGDNSGRVFRKETFIPRGLGAESNSIQLRVHKEELERGVFI